MQAPLVVSIAGREPCCLSYWRVSGEDDDDPNIAIGDGRAPPQGSTAPLHGGGQGYRAAGLQGGVCFTIAITSSIF